MQEEQKNYTPLTTVTSASEIKQKSLAAKQGKVVELPSGVMVRLARPSFRGLLKAGKVPESLIPTAMGVVGGSNSPVTKKQIEDSMEVVAILIREAFVEPKMVKENPQENEVVMEDFDDVDISFMMEYVQKGSADLKSFRGE